MNNSTRSRNELQHFEFPDLGRNIRANNMTNDSDDSVDSNNAASVDGGATGGGTATAKAPEQWCENPMYGDFNPGTSHGRDIFSKKTKGLADDKKFEVTTRDAGAIRKFLVGKQSSLGKVVTRVPVEYNEAGVAIRFANLIQQHQSVPFVQLQRLAHERYGTALHKDQEIPSGPWTSRELDPANVPDDKVTFFSRVHSNVIVELLKNTLTSTGFSKIVQGKRDQITFTCPETGNEKIDGPCLLYLLFDRVDPSLVVSMETLREQIETAKLHQFKGNVDELLTHIEERHEKILDNGATCESIKRYTFNALLSGSCLDFNNFVKNIKGDVDSGIGTHADITFERLVLAARKKYLNMVASNEYSAIDPKDAQLMTLATELKALKEKSANATNGGGGGGGGGGATRGGGAKFECVPGTNLWKWRTIKGKTSVVVNGLTYYWCSCHPDPGERWNGLYNRHKENDHDADVAKNKDRFGKKTHSTNKGGGGEGGSNNLVVSEQVKEVLCGLLMLDDDNADKICTDILNHGGS